MVGLLKLEDERPWGSFFLQYLWEFGLGMWIAERCMHEGGCDKELLNIRNYRWWRLILGAVGGMGLSAFMAWNGGALKLYNDIPSLLGYLSVALIIYKIGVEVVNYFFEWANGFSYELYLVHSLVYTIVASIAMLKMPVALLLIVSLITAYIIAYGYRSLTKSISIAK